MSIARILKDHREAGTASGLLALWGFVDDHAFLTKAGAVGVVYRLEGADYECLDHAERRLADGDLERYFRCRHPHVRHVRYAGQQRSEAYTHGREAGRKIIIHKGMREHPAERGLALPPRR